MDDKAGVRPRIPGRFSARPGSGVRPATPSRAHSRLSAAGQESASGTSRTPSGLAAATIVTAQAGGDLTGTLISTVPAQPDASVRAQRSILLG